MKTLPLMFFILLTLLFAESLGQARRSRSKNTSRPKNLIHRNRKPSSKPKPVSLSDSRGHVPVGTKPKPKPKTNPRRKPIANRNPKPKKGLSAKPGPKTNTRLQSKPKATPKQGTKKARTKVSKNKGAEFCNPQYNWCMALAGKKGTTLYDGYFKRCTAQLSSCYKQFDPAKRKAPKIGKTKRPQKNPKKKTAQKRSNKSPQRPKPKSKPR